MELVHFSIETRGVTWGFPILRPDRPPCASLATLSCLKLRGLEWWSRVAPCLGPKLGKKTGQMTHFHPFPSISPRFGYPKSFGATLWSGLWKLAGSIGSHGFPWVPLGSHGSSARNCWVTDEPNWKVWRFHRAPLPYTYTVGTWFRNEGHRHNQPSLCRCESQSFNIFHHHTDLDTPCVFIHAIAFCLDIRRCPKMGVPQVTMDLNTKMNLKKNKWPILE